MMKMKAYTRWTIIRCILSTQREVIGFGNIDSFIIGFFFFCCYISGEIDFLFCRVSTMLLAIPPGTNYSPINILNQSNGKSSVPCALTDQSGDAFCFGLHHTMWYPEKVRSRHHLCYGASDFAKVRNLFLNKISTTLIFV